MEGDSSNQLRFAQCFGDKGEIEDVTEGKSPVSASRIMLTAFVADIISTVEFDHTGNYLATGDKGGRVVLFERNEQVSISCQVAVTALTSRNGVASTNSTPKCVRPPVMLYSMLQL